MTKKLTYPEIIKLIARATNTTEDILNKLSIYSVIELTAKGLTISEISGILDVDESDIVDDLLSFSSFAGFKEKPGINPIYMLDVIKIEDWYFPEDLLNFLYKYKDLRKELQGYGIA